MTFLDKWHDAMHAQSPAQLWDLISPDAQFFSPVVHTPQIGQKKTFSYLLAAMKVLGSQPSFRYVNQWQNAAGAILEFECDLISPQGKTVKVNGIDMIEWNNEQKITSFKVMVRPKQAMETLQQLMATQLSKL
jgi:hypothetical protein